MQKKQVKEENSDMEFKPMSKLLTSKQAAELLNISVRTLDRLREANAIGYIRVSAGCIRFREEDCKTFMNTRYVGTL